MAFRCMDIDVPPEGGASLMGFIDAYASRPDHLRSVNAFSPEAKVWGNMPDAVKSSRLIVAMSFRMSNATEESWALKVSPHSAALRAGSRVEMKKLFLNLTALATCFVRHEDYNRGHKPHTGKPVHVWPVVLRAPYVPRLGVKGGQFPKLR